MSLKILEQPARVAVIELSIEIAADRQTVYRAFTGDMASWFYESEESRDKKVTIIEHELGGRVFIRTLANGDENLMANITLIKKNRELRMKGDFTVPEAFIANVTIGFEDAGVGTKVSILHRMAGDFSDDMPAGFDEGWMDGLEKLKTLVEGKSSGERSDCGTRAVV